MVNNITVNEQTHQIIEDLVSRDGYLVVKGNQIATSLGSLTVFQHRVMDFCLSYVKKESDSKEEFSFNVDNFLSYYNLQKGGSQYRKLAHAMDDLASQKLYISEKETKKKLRIIPLFAYVNLDEEGNIEFKFSKEASPYIFALSETRYYYSMKLGETRDLRGKHAFTLFNLWRARQHGNQSVTIIKGTVEEWQEWFLGKIPKNNRPIPYVFKRDVLTKAIEELEVKKGLSVVIHTKKRGRSIVGYELEINTPSTPSLHNLNILDWSDLYLRKKDFLELVEFYLRRKEVKTEVVGLLSDGERFDKVLEYLSGKLTLIMTLGEIAESMAYIIKSEPDKFLE